MSSKLKDDNIDFLFRAILELETIDDCYDFFEDLLPQLKTQKEILKEDNLNSLERSILDALDFSGTDTSTISLRTSCPLGHLVAALNKLELSGQIIRLPNSLWVRKSQLKPSVKKTQAQLF